MPTATGGPLVGTDSGRVLARTDIARNLSNFRQYSHFYFDFAAGFWELQLKIIMDNFLGLQEIIYFGIRSTVGSPLL